MDSAITEQKYQSSFQSSFHTVTRTGESGTVLRNLPPLNNMTPLVTFNLETQTTSKVFPLQCETQFYCTWKHLISNSKSGSVCTYTCACLFFCAYFPHVRPLMAVRLCLSACSSWISSDSSVAATSFSFSASVSLRTVPPCWTGGETETKAYCPFVHLGLHEAKFPVVRFIEIF